MTSGRAEREGVVQRYPGAYRRRLEPAVVSPTTGFVQSYAELDDSANRLCRLIREAGIVAGDVVVVFMENHDRYLEVVWGCHYSGVVYVPVSSRWTASELSHVLNDSRARAVITTANLARVATDAVGDHSLAMKLVLDADVDGYSRYERALNDQKPSTPSGPRVAGTAMLYSSGTSGKPKAISRQQMTKPVETAPIGSSYAAKRYFGFDDRTVFLSCAPLYHGGPLGLALATLALGGTVVMLKKFSPVDYLSAVERYQVTHSFVVPTMMKRLLELPEDQWRGFRTSSLRVVVHSAAPCPVWVKRAFIEWLGPVVWEFYAGTEANGMVMCDSTEWLERPGTVGRPVGCSVHICNESGDELAHDCVGTVYFGGGPTFEYRNDPDNTASSRHPRGWTTLGDVGYLDGGGYLFLTDRKSNLIISGGVNIYPQEIEDLLSGHQEVADVAVFGIPDDDLGERVHAVVEPKAWPMSGLDRDRLTEELTALCRSQLAVVKCPRGFEYREQLPREPTGKLMKRHLRSEYWESSGRAI